MSDWHVLIPGQPIGTIPIDALFLDRQLCVVHVQAALVPWRATRLFRAATRRAARGSFRRR